jgi:hypothetical protein
MSTITSPVFQPSNNREVVAATVRAELSARKVRVSHLPALLGNSREYWRRRVTDATTALDIDDLDSLAGLLGLTVGELVRETKTTPKPDGPEGVSLPELDSNQQPAG